jgi:hypothetical protein
MDPSMDCHLHRFETGCFKLLKRNSPLCDAGFELGRSSRFGGKFPNDGQSATPRGRRKGSCQESGQNRRAEARARSVSINWLSRRLEIGSR